MPKKDIKKLDIYEIKRLVKSYKEGNDIISFEILYKQYERLARKIMYSCYTGFSESEIRAIYSLSLSKTCMGFKSAKENSSFNALLGAIVRNESILFRQNDTKDHKLLTLNSTIKMKDEQTSSFEDVIPDKELITVNDVKIENIFFHHLLEELSNQVDAKAMSILKLRLEGYTQEQIVDTLDISRSVVNRRLRLIRELMTTDERLIPFTQELRESY